MANRMNHPDKSRKPSAGPSGESQSGAAQSGTADSGADQSGAAPSGAPRREHVSEVQRTYADILKWFVLLGLALLFITFLFFASGIMPERVPAHEVSRLWHLSAAEFQDRTNFPRGWDWVGELRYGDVLTFGALAFLASGTIVCFGFATVLFVRRRDWPYAAMVALQIVVLVLAASGVLSGH